MLLEYCSFRKIRWGFIFLYSLRILLRRINTVLNMLEHWGQQLERLKANRFFEFTVVAVIVFAALLAGARTYDIDPSVQQLISVLDIAVTVFFVVELTLRFLTEKNKRSFLKDGWNVFDTVIVFISLIPLGNSDMVIVGRLLRIFRVLRMVSIIPELRILLNSLARALPQLGYIVLLMFIIFYIYAAIGSTLFHQINPQLWDDISVSLLTLFRVMTFEDWTDVMYETMEVHPLSWIYYLSFIFLTAFAFLNMVIGIVVNVIEQESQKERDAILEHSGEPTMLELQAEIRELKVLLERKL